MGQYTNVTLLSCVFLAVLWSPSVSKIVCYENGKENGLVKNKTYVTLLSCVFLAGLWSPAGKGLTSRLSCM